MLDLAALRDLPATRYGFRLGGVATGRPRVSLNDVLPPALWMRPRDYSWRACHVALLVLLTRTRSGVPGFRTGYASQLTPHLPELASLPYGLAVDGELIAFGDDGKPSFPRLCDRMLHGKQRVEVMLIVFDVLAIDGQSVHRRPYWERRLLLEDLALDGDHWSTTSSHTDGEALWEKVCRLGLEGVVAKKR